VRVLPVPCAGPVTLTSEQPPPPASRGHPRRSVWPAANCGPEFRSGRGRATAATSPASKAWPRSPSTHSARWPPRHRLARHRAGRPGQQGHPARADRGPRPRPRGPRGRSARRPRQRPCIAGELGPLGARRTTGRHRQSAALPGAADLRTAYCDHGTQPPALFIVAHSSLCTHPTARRPLRAQISAAPSKRRREPTYRRVDARRYLTRPGCGGGGGGGRN